MPETTSEVIRRLVEQRWRGMVLFARQWCHEPEDVVQDAFIKLILQTPPPDDQLLWLYRVIRNEAISRQRRQRNRSAREASVANSVAWISSLDDQLDSQLASEALEELPSELREVVIGRIWGELTFQQIADVCQISVTTAFRRYKTALAKLRDHLQIKHQGHKDKPRHGYQ